MYTVAGAYATFEEDIKGQLKPACWPTSPSWSGTPAQWIPWHWLNCR